MFGTPVDGDDARISVGVSLFFLAMLTTSCRERVGLERVGRTAIIFGMDAVLNDLRPPNRLIAAENEDR